MSSSSDSDLETGITEQLALTKTKSVKKKTKLTTDHGKNEGDDPRWAYEPPEGAVLLEHTVDVGAFEWDEIKDDEDTEIWLIRVPDSIKSKHLKGLETDPPSSSRTARIGSLTRKDTSYDVWSIGNDDANVAGGEELQSLSCLLPRKSQDGKLYIAPKPVSHHIVISAQPSIATPPEGQPLIYQNPPRPSYPKDVLKHSFTPYGARSKQTQWEDLSTDVDTAVDKLAETEIPLNDQSAKTTDSKRRRKVDEDTPKKSKKHKTKV